MEALRNCQWWTRKKIARTYSVRNTAEEATATKKEETAGKTKRLMHLLRGRRYEGTRKFERWRWKLLWKQQTPPEASLFDFPDAVSLPVVLSNKAVNNKERDRGRGGEASVMSSTGHKVRETRLVHSHSLASSSYTGKDDREELQDEQREEQENARDVARHKELGSVCGGRYERRSKEENAPAQGTRRLQRKDNICSEHFRKTCSTNSKFGQMWENAGNQGPGETQSSICTYSGQEEHEIISSLGRMQPAKENSTFSRFREKYASGRSAPNTMIIAPNRNAPSTVATSCPPSPADTDRVSLFLSSPTTASTACRRGATDAADVPAGDTAAATAAVVDDVPADKSPQTPVATEHFVFPGVNGIARSVAGAAYSTRKRQSVDEEDFEKRRPSSKKTDARPLLQTDPHAFRFLRTTAAVGRLAAGIRPAETGTEELPAAFRSPHVAQLSTCRQAAFSSVKPIRPSTSATAIEAAPLLEASRSFAGSLDTDGYARQQDADGAKKLYQEQQQQQVFQQLQQQQNPSEHHPSHPINVTQLHRGRIPQGTVTPSSTSLSRAAASVSRQCGCIGICPARTEVAEEMKPSSVSPLATRAKRAGNVAANSQASRTEPAALQSPAATAEEASRTAAANISVPERLLTHLESARVTASATATLADAITDAVETAPATATAFHRLLPAHDDGEGRPDVSGLSPLSGCSVAASMSTPISSAGVPELAASRRNSVSRSVSSCPSSRSSGRRISCNTPLSSNDAAAAKVGLLKSEATAEIKSALLNVFKPFTIPQWLTLNEVDPAESATGFCTSRCAAAAPTPPASQSAICGVVAPICCPSLSARPCSSSSTVQAFFDDVDLFSQQNQQQQQCSSTPTTRSKTALSRRQMAVRHSNGEESNSNTSLPEATIAAEKALYICDSIFTDEAEEQHSGTTPNGLTAKQSGTEKTAGTSCLECSDPKTTRSIMAATDGSAAKGGADQNIPLTTRLKGICIASSIVKTAGANTGEEKKQNAHHLEKQQSGHPRQEPPVPVDPGYINAIEKKRQLHHQQQLDHEDGGICDMVNSSCRDGSAFTRVESLSRQQHVEDAHRPTSSSCRHKCLLHESSAADSPSAPATLLNAGGTTGEKSHACGSLSASHGKAAAVSLISRSTVSAAIEGETENQQQQQQLCRRSFQQWQVAEGGTKQPEQEQQMEQEQTQQQLFNQKQGCLPHCTEGEASLLLKRHLPEPSSLPPAQHTSRPCGDLPQQQSLEEAQDHRKAACGRVQEDPLKTGAAALTDKTTASRLFKVRLSSDACLSVKVDPLPQPETTAGIGSGGQIVSSQRSAGPLAAADAPSECFHGTRSSPAAVIEASRVVLSSSAGRATTPAAEREGEEAVKAENVLTAATVGGEGTVTHIIFPQKEDKHEEERMKDTTSEETPIPRPPGAIINQGEEVVLEKRETDVSSAVTSEAPAGQLSNDGAVGGVKAPVAPASSAPSLLHTTPSAAKAVGATVMVAAAETPTTVQGSTVPSLALPSGQHGEPEMSTTKEVAAAVALNKIANAGSKSEEELTLTETVLATVGQGVTTVLEYGATTLRDFITESLPALSSDEGTSPCSSPSHHAYGKRGSSSDIWRSSSGIWRSSSGSRKHAAREAQGSSRPRSVRRACSAGATPVPHASFQSTWARSDGGSVLLPPPLLVGECMLPSAAASRGERLPPPLSNTTKTCRRSNSFSEAQHSSQLRQAWNLAALGQTHTKRLPPSFFSSTAAACASTTARREVGGVADATSKQECYFRTPSPAYSEPSSLCRRRQQQPDRLLQYRHHTPALAPVMLAAGRQMSDHRRLSAGAKTLEYDRASSAFSIQNSPEHQWRPSFSPAPAGFHTAASSLIQPAGRPPPLPTHCGRLLLPLQPSPRLRIPSPTASCRNTTAAVISSADIITSHAGFVDRAPPLAAGAAASVHVSETGAENMIGSQVKRVATASIEHQQKRSGRSNISVPPVLPKFMQKEGPHPVRYMQQVPQQQQPPQGLCSPSGQVSQYCVLPAAGFISQTRGNPPSETDAQGQHVDVSRVQNLQTLQADHNQELLQRYHQQQQHQYPLRIDTHSAATRGMEAEFLSHTFGSNETSVMSPAWQMLPSSSCSNAAGFRHSADTRDRLVVPEGDECEKTSHPIRYTSPRFFKDSGSGGEGVKLQQQKEVELPQQHHLLGASPRLGLPQQVLLPAVDFHSGKEHSTFPPYTVRKAHAATVAEAFQSHRHNHTHDTDAEESAACSCAAVHLAVTAGAPMLGRTSDGSAVAGVHSTEEHNAKVWSPSSYHRGQSWLCEQQQRRFQYSESREPQLQFQNSRPALHRDNPAMMQGKNTSLTAEVKCTSGGAVRPAVAAGLGQELTEHTRRTGVDDEKPCTTLTAVPNVFEVSNAKISAIQHGQLHQSIRQSDPAHLPELAAEKSERGGLELSVQARDETAAHNRELFESVSLTVFPSTHRGEREVRTTAARQAAVLTGHEPHANWGMSCSLAFQQNTEDSYHSMDLSKPDLTQGRHEIVSTSRLHCGSPVKDGNDRSDGVISAATAGGTAAISRNSKAGGIVTTGEAARRVEVPVIGSEGEQASHPFWRQERMSNLQDKSQQQESQESQHCQVLSEIQEQHHREGLVKQPRPPSPFRARWLREELIRKRATGQLCRENFPLEEVENLLQSFQVRKINGVLIYDIGGQEPTRSFLPQSEAAGAAAVTFSLPDSRSASGFSCKSGLTAGGMRANKEWDEEARNRSTANRGNSQLGNSDSSSSHSYVNSNCCNNGSEWSSMENTQGRKFEGSQYDSQNIQPSSHFDVWLHENHRVGEQFLKDVEQIVDVAATLYASHETGG